MTVRWKHVVFYFLFAICLWLWMFVLGREDITRFHAGIIRQNLLHHATLAEVLFNLSDRTLDSRVDEIAGRFDYQITIISERGDVVADSLFSDEQLERMGNQLELEEIQEAIREGKGTAVRYFPYTSGWFLYAAVRLSGGGFVRLSTPVAAPEEE